MTSSDPVSDQDNGETVTRKFHGLKCAGDQGHVASIRRNSAPRLAANLRETPWR
jgi:hypothetical protein